MAPASGGPGGDLRWRSSLRLEPATTQTAKCTEQAAARENHILDLQERKKNYIFARL